jgi:membrane protein YdbS with pleckstrin-like domain
MGYPRKLLGADERIVHELHPHWKALFFPVLLVPVVVGVGTYLYFVIPDGRFQTAARIAVVVVGLALLIWGSLVPFLRWQTTLYVMTTDRIITRTGVLTRTGRDIPLSRVNDVSFTHNIFERMLRCGTLTVESAGERGQLVLTDVPKVEHVHRELYRLVDEHLNERGMRPTGEMEIGPPEPGPAP